MQEPQESSAAIRLTREQLLSRYRRFECPAGLEAHSLVYNPQPPPEPELYNIPANLSTAVSIKKVPRTAVAAAVGAALGASPTRPTPAATAPTTTVPPATAAAVPIQPPGGGTVTTTTSPSAADTLSKAIGMIPPPSIEAEPLMHEDMSKAIIRWSDGRPLYMVAFRDLLPLAATMDMQRTIMRGRRYQELYEALVADVYYELCRQKRLLLPPPLVQAFRLTSETSIALWPTFRELFVQTEELLPHLSMWEPTIGHVIPEVEPAVVVLPPDVQWEYLDPQSNVQGPFTSVRMSEWFRGDFFPPTLPIRMCGQGPFVPLVELYPLTQRDLYVPFITAPMAAPPRPVLEPPTFQSNRTLLSATTSAAEPHISGDWKQVATAAATTTNAPPPPPQQAAKLRPATVPQKDAEDLEAKRRINESKWQEEAKRDEADRIQRESERVAEAILREKQRESQELMRQESLRKAKEARDARILAEHKMVENTMKQRSGPLNIGLSSGVSSSSGSGAPWKQPTSIIDDQDAGPSLEESRRIRDSNHKTNAGAGQQEWSKKLAVKGGKPAVKGKKLEDVIPPRTPWQIKPLTGVNSNGSKAAHDTPWLNEPSLDLAASAIINSRETSRPPAVKAPTHPPSKPAVQSSSTAAAATTTTTTKEVVDHRPVALTPATAAAVAEVAVAGAAAAAAAAASSSSYEQPAAFSAVSDDARVNVQDLCAHYHIDLDPDFVTMLIGMPDLDTVKSFLTDNLPHLSDKHVSDFAEAFWDVVRNPFQPVAPKKSTTRRK